MKNKRGDYMRFYAIADNNAVVFTDDYDFNEITRGLHLDNIREDFRKYDNISHINVFTEDNRICARLSLV